MSRIRYAGGTITKTTGGDHKIYSEGNIVQNAGGAITETGKEKGVSFGKPEHAPPLKLENGVDTFVIFEPTIAFDGEFGFDWLNWSNDDKIERIQSIDISNLEYVFNDAKLEYESVATNVGLRNKLKSEYKKHQVNYAYYLPWLNILPTQGEIKLNMLTKLIIPEQDISKEEITFEKNDFYQVTIDSLINENIKYTPDGKPKEITIKCIKPSAEIDIIAKNKKGNIIGKLRVKDNINTFNLPVRLVCVVKDTSKKDVEINKLISDIKSNKIEDYLNKNSLNQALIKTTLEIDSKYQIAFDENVWDGKFYDKTNDWLTDKITTTNFSYTDDDGYEFKDVKKQYILDKFLADYRAKFETDGKKFRGILLFITNLAKNPADKQGGVSRTQPTNFREAIVFKPNLKDKPTYAHEIAHALGLEHFFWRDAEYKAELDDTKNNIKRNNEAKAINKNNIKISTNNIKTSKDNIAIYNENIKEYEAYQKTHPNYYKENPKIYAYVKEQKAGIITEKENIKKAEKNIKENQDANDKIEKNILDAQNNLGVYKSNKFKFKETSTLNIMDYSTKTNIFSSWQWGIMQSDIKKYYGSVTINK
ncbi:hypothetical protein [Flavobacterium sp.]|uniref:hypothetical protein n=1 Tax=Flavobacterium sp. TaxID=239 RepID=UPI0037512475